ncbi:hypothetical protein [Flavobacterium sp.]|uniref:hypothetical protein n=1 Tax=Flavobacterium sp. TaxID=239 RepID=UPI002A8020C3|nr:hypothetical protein [Flavobacterium sp.]
MKETSNIIYKIFFIITLPLLVFAFLYVNHQNNDINIVKKEYERIRNKEITGLVIEKKKDGNYPRASRYVFLKNYFKVIISNELYTKITVGDSISKSKNSDSIYFYLKNGNIEIEDYNQFNREKYIELKNRKR